MKIYWSNSFLWVHTIKIHTFIESFVDGDSRFVGAVWCFDRNTVGKVKELTKQHVPRDFRCASRRMKGLDKEAIILGTISPKLNPDKLVNRNFRKWSWLEEHIPFVWVKRKANQIVSTQCVEKQWLFRWKEWVGHHVHRERLGRVVLEEEIERHLKVDILVVFDSHNLFVLQRHNGLRGLASLGLDCQIIDGKIENVGVLHKQKITRALDVLTKDVVGRVDVCDANAPRLWS
jgi:hypothetical protein